MAGTDVDRSSGYDTDERSEIIWLDINDALYLVLLISRRRDAVTEHVYVSHIDGNYDNNMVRNLKWITASENSKSNIEKYPENRLKLKKANEENGYYKKLRHRIWKKTNLKKVGKMENWGVSQKEIARIYECSVSTVYNVIKKLKS